MHHKNLIFKTLDISKVAHLALVKDVPSSTIGQLDKIQNLFGKTKILN